MWSAEISFGVVRRWSGCSCPGLSDRLWAFRRPDESDELIEEELVRLCGQKGKHDPERSASRHGSRRSQVVLGARKVSARRPRARTVDDQELPLSTWELFRSEELLDERTVEVMLAGLSTRRYADGLEPTAADAERSSSRSSLSRRSCAAPERGSASR
jgi:putative transposase